jgi:hypothetical protein
LYLLKIWNSWTNGKQGDNKKANSDPHEKLTTNIVRQEELS